MFAPDVERCARAHAAAEWPHEAVGYVIGEVYCPQHNIGRDRSSEFVVAPEAWSDDVRAVIHSHVNGKLYPSAADMAAQQASAVPWGLTVTDGRATSPLLWFGDHVLDQPLIGRRFVPGVTDCYELLRAWYWQERSIKLKSFPRDAEWWTRGANLFANFRTAGFERIAIADARPGDSLLMAIPALGVINHCAVLLDSGLMLHHRSAQLSRREPWSGAWRRLTRMAVRYV